MIERLVEERVRLGGEPPMQQAQPAGDGRVAVAVEHIHHGGGDTGGVVDRVEAKVGEVEMWQAAGLRTEGRFSQTRPRGRQRWGKMW